MSATCVVPGPWTNVHLAVAPSVNEFQTESLAILTQVVNQLSGGSLPIPTAIPSDGEFRAGALAALCYIAQNITGGGGGSPLLNGNGSPLGSVAGAKGQRYHDDIGGTFWTNLDGTVNGWAVG